MFFPSPIVRGLATTLALIAAFVVQDSIIVAIAYLLFLLPLLFTVNVIRVHAKFVAIGMLPLAAGLMILWSFIVAAPPGMPKGSAPLAGAMHALLITFRLLTIAGIFQLCFLSIPFVELLAVLRRWGLNSDAISIVASVLTVWPETKMRAEEIVTARYARGLVASRSLFTTARQMPAILRPLLVWALHTGIARSRMWHEQKLLESAIVYTTPRSGTMLGNSLFLFLSIVWLIIAMVSRGQ